MLTDLEPSGIIPSAGRPDSAVACSGVRTVLSHVLQYEGQAYAGDDAEHEGESQVARDIGFAGRGRNTGRIDDAKVIGA